MIYPAKPASWRRTSRSWWAVDRRRDRHGPLADERDGHSVGANAVARGAAGGVGGVDKNPAEIKRTTARTLRLRPSSLNPCRGWTVHGKEFSFPTLATGDERGQVREKKAHGKVPVLPRGGDVDPLRQADGRAVTDRGNHEGARRRVAGKGIRARPALR